MFNYNYSGIVVKFYNFIPNLCHINKILHVRKIGIGII
jgi:hypothetical protein